MAELGLKKQDYPEEVEVKNCQCLEVGLNQLETMVGVEFFYELQEKKKNFWLLM